MNNEDTVSPVIEVRKPPVKAINTCSCCTKQGDVAVLKMGWEMPSSKNSGAASVVVCLDCLLRAEMAITKYLDEHKRPRYGIRVDSDE